MDTVCDYVLIPGDWEGLRVNSVVWDGTDNYHNQVASGIYLYRIVDDGKILAAQKMLMMK